MIVRLKLTNYRFNYALSLMVSQINCLNSFPLCIFSNFAVKINLIMNHVFRPPGLHGYTVD